MKDILEYLNSAQDLIDNYYVRDVDVMVLAKILRDKDEREEDARLKEVNK